MLLSKKIKCFKYLVFSYIVLLAISGAVQIVLGGLLVWGHLGYTKINDNYFWLPSTLQICLGPLTILICWLGWNATNKKNECKLTLFGACIVIICCVQFFLCGWSFAMRNTLPTSAEYPIQRNFDDFAQNYMNPNQSHIWNRVQYELKCCGVHGPHDYQHMRWYPFSCCARQEKPTDGHCHTNYKRGCLEVLADGAKVALLEMALVALALGLVQSLGIFFIIHLIILIRRKAREDSPPITLRSKQKQLQELSPLSARTVESDTETTLKDKKSLRNSRS